MTTYPWRAALTRWGDALFRLALLLTDDRTAAERATITAFTRSFARPSEDPETALYAALLQHKLRRRNPLRRRSLPRVLDRIAPTDRVLLGAWLLRDLDGPRLLAIAGQPAEAVLPRLAAAIEPFLDVEDFPPADTDSRQLFEQWLGRRLGLAPATSIETTSFDRAQSNGWQAALDELRQTLREAVGKQHLPTTCVEQIEIEMLEPHTDEPTRWWQQRAALIGAVAVVLTLIWIVKPWQQGLSGPAGAALTSKELVQKTLDGWTTTPVTGTLHLKVVASEPRLGQRPLTTDVWLTAESAQHRVEVRNGESLIEWQIGDDKHKLSYAAFPLSSSCDWAVEASVLDQTARTFALSAEQQRAARDAALTRGAYGQGYLALQAALAAPDLRSFGTHIEGKTTLLVLGFTDRRSTPERRLLLWIDPARYTLHAVREVADAGGQSNAHDLWRLQSSEASEIKISAVPPSWPGETQRRDQLLDPRCPGLDPDHILSLRSFLTSRWWSFQQWYLPAEPPEDTKFAALVTPSFATSGILDSGLVNAIFVGSDRWLQLRMVARDSSPTTGIDRDGWRVRFDEGSNILRGSACRRFTDTRSGFCVPSITFRAQGWTQEELLTLIESFRPLDGQAWLQYNKLFLDPQPLTADVQSVTEQSLAAIQQLKQGSLYSVAEERSRVDPDQPTYQDPYHIPLELVYPERATHEQWLSFADAQVAQFRNITKNLQGELLSTQLNDGKQYSEYHLPTSTLWRAPAQGLDGSTPTTSWIGEELLFAMIASREPITARKDNGGWLLEQAFHEQPNQDGWFDDRYISLSNVRAWIEDLTVREFTRRIWIDPATSLPLKTTIVQRDPQGNEIEILAINISVRPQPEPFTDQTFSLPKVPPDTITFQSDGTSQTTIAADSLPITLPARVLVWDGNGIETVRQFGRFNPAVFNSEDRTNTIYQAFSILISELDQSGLIYATGYRIQADEATVVLRQGPASLLRYNLRTQGGLGLSNDGSQHRTSSKSLSATIAGESRTVWLLETSNQAMLVFEIDNLLVHILGSDADLLEQSVLPALSKLEWAPAPSSP